MRSAVLFVTTLVVVLALGLALGIDAPPARERGGAGPQPTDDRSDKIRGVTVSTHRSGQEWGSDAIGPTFEQIQTVGASWVATHPYAWIDGDGTVRFREFDPADAPAHIVRPIREAHARGLKILIKPHLGYWGSPFGWRGEIGFDDEASWRRFFTSYERWIVALAAACSEADGFVVGVELDRTLGHEAEWRRIVAAIREVSGAPLTYAANWPEYARVPFWDAVDAIGIQAYFPLTEEPTRDTRRVRDGWRKRMRELAEFSAAEGKPIVFTELGYNRSFDAAHRPWDYRVDGRDAEPFQAAVLQTALEAIEAEPSVVGVFLWKWFPEPHPVGRNFQLATPTLRDVIAGVWRDAD